MKRRFIILFVVTILIAALCMPLNAYARTINTEAYSYLLQSESYSSVAPDLHYILDDSKPYQLLFVGNDNIPKNASSWYMLAGYDLIFIQTVGQPMSTYGNDYTAMYIDGSDKSYSMYACHFGDEEWTPIVLNGTKEYGIYLTNSSTTGFDECLVGSNIDFMDIINKVSVEPMDYLFYAPDRNGNDNSDYSTIDYNGHVVRSNNRSLTYIKLVSHYFVKKFLKPLIDYIAAEPILLLIVFVSFSISLITLLIAIYNRITSKGLKRRRKRG